MWKMQRCIGKMRDLILGLPASRDFSSVHAALHHNRLDGRSLNAPAIAGMTLTASEKPSGVESCSPSLSFHLSLLPRSFSKFLHPRLSEPGYSSFRPLGMDFIVKACMRLSA